MPEFPVTRAGAILAVSDFAASLRFYRDQLGLVEVALYDDPPYATLTAAGARSRSSVPTSSRTTISGLEWRWLAGRGGLAGGGGLVREAIGAVGG